MLSHLSQTANHEVKGQVKRSMSKVNVKGQGHSRMSQRALQASDVTGACALCILQCTILKQAFCLAWGDHLHKIITFQTHHFMNAQTTQTNAQMDAHANVHASAHIYAQMNACSLHACGLCAQFYTWLHKFVHDYTRLHKNHAKMKTRYTKDIIPLEGIWIKSIVSLSNIGLCTIHKCIWYCLINMHIHITQY